MKTIKNRIDEKIADAVAKCNDPYFIGICDDLKKDALSKIERIETERETALRYVKSIPELSEKELDELRKEVCLNSDFYRDYKNSFGIDGFHCYEFFKGYVVFLSELERENGESLNFSDFIEKYDTIENLIEWRNIVDYDEKQSDDMIYIAKSGINGKCDHEIKETIYDFEDWVDYYLGVYADPVSA